MSDTTENGRRPRGWFAQRVEQMSQEMIEMQEEWKTLRRHMKKNADVEELLKHPLFISYTHFEQRLRRVEALAEELLRAQNEVRQLTRQSQQVLDALQTRRGAGGR